MKRAENFCENFTKVWNLIAEKAPKDLTYAIFIYARDTSNRTETEPDWEMYFKCIDKTWYFDRATIKKYVDENF